MSEARLPAHVEVNGLIRAVQAAGGFATVLAKGERDGGTILVICCERGGLATVYERMPQADGTRNWTQARRQDAENRREFEDYLERRRGQDRDLWIVELDVSNPERFIESPGTLN